MPWEGKIVKPMHRKGAFSKTQKTFTHRVGRKAGKGQVHPAKKIPSLSDKKGKNPNTRQLQGPLWSIDSPSSEPLIAKA